MLQPWSSRLLGGKCDPKLDLLPRYEESSVGVGVHQVMLDELVCIRLDSTDTKSELLGKGRLPYFDQDEVHDIYRAWRPILDSYPGGRMAVAEAWADDPPSVLRAGGLGVRELRRSAALLDGDVAATVRA